MICRKSIRKLVLARCDRKMNRILNFIQMFLFLHLDELTLIVKDEMDRNTNLSKDLQKLRQATAAIETTQNGQNQENVSADFFFFFYQ